MEEERLEQSKKEERLRQLKEELKLEGLDLSEEDLKKMLDKINEQEEEE